MDAHVLHTIYTVLMFICFIGICIWAYSGKRKADFEEAANLPFADEPQQNKGDRA